MRPTQGSEKKTSIIISTPNVSHSPSVRFNRTFLNLYHSCLFRELIDIVLHVDGVDVDIYELLSFAGTMPPEVIIYNWDKVVVELQYYVQHWSVFQGLTLGDWNPDTYSWDVIPPETFPGTSGSEDWDDIGTPTGGDRDWETDQC